MQRSEELDRLTAEVSQQKWLLVREKKSYEDERRQLARLLLGMGEKISCSTPDDQSLMDDGIEPSPPFNQHRTPQSAQASARFTNKTFQ